MMRNIVAREIMNTSFIKTDPRFQEIQKEFQLVQFQIQQQNVQLGRIEQHIRCPPQSDILGSSAKDPTPMESSKD